MNRHERRKVGKLSKTVEQVTVRGRAALDQLSNGWMCAGVDCGETFEGRTLPPGWRTLIAHSSPRLGTELSEIKGHEWHRDTQLCPRCWEVLNSTMKNIDVPADGPPAGSA